MTPTAKFFLAAGSVIIVIALAAAFLALRQGPAPEGAGLPSATPLATQRPRDIGPPGGTPQPTPVPLDPPPAGGLIYGRPSATTSDGDPSPPVRPPARP